MVSLTRQPRAASKDGILSLLLPRFLCDGGKIAELVTICQKSCRSSAPVPGCSTCGYRSWCFGTVMWISPGENLKDLQFFSSNLGRLFSSCFDFFFNTITLGFSAVAWNTCERIRSGIEYCMVNNAGGGSLRRAHNRSLFPVLNAGEIPEKKHHL